MDANKLNDFVVRYTAAWCSQHAASVASFFAEQGSLKINDGAPAIGRDAITSSAQDFMSAFPDLVVKMDRLAVNGTKTEYHWTLTGTNTGPGGTGKFVRIRCDVPHVTQQPWLKRTAAQSAATKTRPLCNEVTGAPRYGAPVSGTSYL
jgi:hypothetical protein